MIPSYSLEFTHRATKKVRFQVRLGSETGTVVDISGWGTIAFMAKRRPTDADTDAIYEKVLFAGVEVIDAEEGMIEVTIDPADGDLLEQGLRHNLFGEIMGIDADLNVYQLNTLAVSAYPRVRRANF